MPKLIGVMINNRARASATNQEIFGAAHIVFEAVGAAVGDSVMNGIYYPKTELEKLAKDTTGRIQAPLYHPISNTEKFLSASDPIALMKHYMGAFAFNWRMKGDRLVCDVAINPEIAAKTDGGQKVLDMIANGQDIDMSTGLLYIPEETKGIGKDGEPYERIARNMRLDHVAILPDEPGAATSDEGVGLFANSEGVQEEITVESAALNASTPAMALPLDFDEFDALGAEQRIREFTDSIDAPSSNYRKFFLEFDRDRSDDFGAYRMLFADIVDGRPVAKVMAIKSYQTEEERGKEAIERYTSLSGAFNNASDVIDDAIKTRNAGPIKALFTKVMNAFASITEIDYTALETETVATNREDQLMRDEILNELKEAGINTDGMDDKAIKNAYKKLGSASNEEDKKEDKADNSAAASNSDSAVLAALNALNKKIETLESGLNASKEAELDTLASQVAGLDIGLNADSAKKLGADALNSLLAKHAGSVAFNASTVLNSQTKSDLGIDLFDAK